MKNLNEMMEKKKRSNVCNNWGYDWTTSKLEPWCSGGHR